MRITGVSTPTRQFKENADWLGTGPDLAVALDGCGLPDAISDEADRRCIHGVPWYVRTLGSSLLRGVADRATPLDDALATAIAETAAAHQGSCDLAWAASPSASVVVVRHNRKGVEYLVLGNSTIVADDGSPEPIVLRDDRVERLPLADIAAVGVDSPDYQHAMRERAKRIDQLRNRPNGFSIAQSDPQTAYKAMVGHLEQERLRRTVLATSGATRLVDLYGRFSWCEWLSLAQDAGPEELIARTREADDEDPQCRKWPRANARDDATAVFCQFLEAALKVICRLATLSSWPVLALRQVWSLCLAPAVARATPNAAPERPTTTHVGE